MWTGSEIRCLISIALSLFALLLIPVGCRGEIAVLTQATATVASPIQEDAGRSVTPIPSPTKPAGSAPAAPNQSVVTAKVLSMAPDSQSALFTRVQVQLLTSTPFPGRPDFTHGLIGKNLVLLVDSSALSGVQVGNVIRASVVFRGDERGGTYQATSIQKLAANP